MSNTTRPKSGIKALKRFAKLSSTRQLQEAEGYSHLFLGDPERDIRRKIKEDFAKYKADLPEGEKPLGIAAFRMRVLRKLLQEEPLEIQEYVREYVSNVDTPGYNEKMEFTNYPDDEATRLGNALSARQ